MKALPTSPDVIVVGAGTAGLSAAKALINEGFEVAVLEAASHVGGRCITDTSLFDVPFDKGGSWMHSAHINPLARLAEQAGAKLYKRPWEWEWVKTGGYALTRAEVQTYSEYHDLMWDSIEQAAAAGDDRSVSMALPKEPWKDTARHWVAQMQGGDADVTSVYDVAQYADAEGDWLVEGGLGGFIAGLFADVAVELNCPVTEIDMTGPRVRVVTPKGVLEAEKLVLTVSTGVLAAETIKFKPALPDAKLTAIGTLPNGLLNKIGLEFDPSWQEAFPGQMADYLKGGEEFCTLLFGFYGTGLAVGFVAGRFADQLEKEGDGAATEFCLQALRDIFGNDATKHVRRTAETAWRGNTNTFGSYSYAKPGNAHARQELAASLDEKLYFAGEATMPEAYATVHGAYLSGIEVARKIAPSNS